MATKSTAIQAVQAFGDNSKKIALANKQTLASYGLDPEKFANAMQEAVRRIPDIARVAGSPASKDSFLAAIRACCADGLIPNNKQAAIYINSQGLSNYLPMKEGLLRVLMAALPGTKVYSGFVGENQKTKVTQRSDGDDSVEIVNEDAFAEKGAVIGSFCVITAPGHFATALLLSRSEIDANRKRSKTKGGPWDEFPGLMAEKSAIKSLVNKMRYLFNDDDDNLAHQRLVSVVEGDSDFTDQREPVDMEDAVISDDEPIVAVAPKKKDSPRQQEDAPLSESPFDMDDDDEQGDTSFDENSPTTNM